MLFHLLDPTEGIDMYETVYIWLKEHPTETSHYAVHQASMHAAPQRLSG